MSTAPPNPQLANSRRRLLIGVVLVGAAIFGFTSLYRDYARAAQSTRWPTTEGRIMDSSVVQSNARRGQEAWTLKVRYNYEIDGRTYDSTVVHFGGFPSTNSIAEAQKAQEKYAVGTTHPVHFDPSKPSRATLEPGAKPALSSLGLGAALLLLVLLLGAVAIYQSLKTPRTPARSD